MTTTTTEVNACDVSIWIDNAAGTLKDVSGSSNEVTLNITKNVGESRVYGSRWPRRLVCGADAKLDITVLYTTTADEGLDVLRDWILSTEDTARSVSLYIPDKNVGSDKYSAEFVLESLDIPTKAGEGQPIMCKGSLLISGALSHTQVAT